MLVYINEYKKNSVVVSIDINHVILGLIDKEIFDKDDQKNGVCDLEGDLPNRIIYHGEKPTLNNLNNVL